MRKNYTFSLLKLVAVLLLILRVPSVDAAKFNFASTDVFATVLATMADGDTLVLTTPGTSAYYTTLNGAITKSITIMADPSLTSRPVISSNTVGACFTPSATVAFTKIEFLGIEAFAMSPTDVVTDSRYFIDGRMTTGSITTLKLKNCYIHGYSRCVVRADGSTPVFTNLVVDSCVFNDNSIGAASYPLFGTKSATITNISITNSTFYNSPGNIITYSKTNALTFLMKNCNVIDYGSFKTRVLSSGLYADSNPGRLIDFTVAANASSTFTIDNCIISGKYTNKDNRPLADQANTGPYTGSNIVRFNTATAANVNFINSIILDNTFNTPATPGGTYTPITCTSLTNFFPSLNIFTDPNTITGTGDPRWKLNVNNDTTLSKLLLDGTTISGFAYNKFTYNIVLPYGTTAIPVVTATTTDPSASALITQAPALTGSATVVVTARDATTKGTYTINISVAPPSADATLSALKVQNKAVKGFAPNITTYDVGITVDTVPAIIATPTFAKANAVITPATAIPGTATIEVTAEDNTTKITYTIQLRKASNDTTLSNLTVGGTQVTGFASNIFTYEVKLPTSATVPAVVGTSTHFGATVLVTPAASIPGTTNVLVTSESDTLKATYKVNFSFIDPILSTTPAGLTIEDFSPKDSITVSAANLTSDITITAPAGITVNPSSIAKGSIILSTVYVTYDGITSVDDSIVLTSGTLVKKVGIKAISNAACFKPLFATGNIISNPYFSTLTGYGGWGSRSITTTPAEVYCGRGSYKTSGGCGGSLDYSLTGKVTANTVYRLKAMANTTGKFKFIINGCSVNGSNDYFLDVNTSSVWQPVVFTFTTGATLAANQNVFFNSCEGYNGSLAYLDNFELYKLPLYVTPSTVDFIGASTKDVTVKAQVLIDSITVSAPAGFSVPKGKLAPDKTSTLSITFDGIAATSGYVYFSSGTNKDSVLVSGTIEPTITISAASLAFDELNPKDSIIVDGGNLTSDITITAPAGITVNPTTILKTDATNIKVMVTYDGTSSVNGNITVTSGTLVKTATVKASTNASCFTPLYAPSVATNLVTDPYLNSLSTFGGWGGTSINTDPAYVYCGTRSGHVNGGSIDQVLTGKLKTNTTYRVKAMVYAVSGTIQVGVFGWSQGQGDINNVVSTFGSWQTVDFTFTTGATLGGSQGVFFNNGDGYIDNFEIYAVPAIKVSPASLSLTGASTKKSAITGINLSSDITITAPTGFSVNPSTLSSTVAGDSISITFDNVANASGYVYLTSGTVKDSIQVTGTKLVSVPSIENLDLITVKPTISSDVFVVEFACKPGTIKVTDSRGAVVSIIKATSTSEVIAVPSAGIYILQITACDVIKTVKVVKTN